MLPTISTAPSAPCPTRNVVLVFGLYEIDVEKFLEEKNLGERIRIPDSDPYTWMFDYLVFYQGVEIIGYAHIQFWPEFRAALRIIVIDEKYRQHGVGSQFLQLCEQWLKRLGIKSIHDEARPDVVSFYRKNG